MSKKTSKSYALKRLSTFLSILSLMVLNSSLAHAACTTPGTLGDIMCTLVAGADEVPTMLAALSYLFGTILVVMAIFKTKEHVENAAQVPISEPIKRILAGGAFLALPTITRTVEYTLTGGASGIATNTVGIAAGSASGTGLDALLYNFIDDIFEPMMFLISGFGYLAGTILVMIGISRMLKTAQDGPRGPAGIGTIFTFLVAGALFSLDAIMSSATGSLFGYNDINATATLLSSSGDVVVDDHILAVVSSVVAFMMIVGLIAFVRGIFILREVAEGSGQASIMAAMSHIIGGALAVNIGGVIDAVQSTFGISLVAFT